MQGRYRHRYPIHHAHLGRRGQARGHPADLVRPARQRILDAEEDRAVRQSARHGYFSRRQLRQGRADLHQGRAPRRHQDLAHRHRADQGELPDRRRVDGVRGRTHRFHDPDPDGLQRRHPRHPPRSDRPSHRQLGRIAEPGIQGQGLDPQHPRDRHHGRRHGRPGHRRDHLRRHGQHDQGGDRQDHRSPDRSQAGRPVPRPLERVQRERQPHGLRRGGDPVHVVAGRHQGALSKVSTASTSP